MPLAGVEFDVIIAFLGGAQAIFAEKKLAKGSKGVHTRNDDAVVPFFGLAERENGVDVFAFDYTEMAAQGEDGTAQKAALGG